MPKEIPSDTSFKSAIELSHTHTHNATERKETRNNVISCSLIITDPVGLLAYREVLQQQKNVSVRLQRACPPNWTAFRFWKPHAQLEKRRAHWLGSDSWFQVSQPILFESRKRLDRHGPSRPSFFFIFTNR